MKNFYSFCLISIVFFQSNAQITSSNPIYSDIAKLDSLLFEEGFNKCNTGALDNIIADDLEFYHDQSGFNKGKKIFIDGIKNNICNLSYRPERRISDSGFKVYLLKSNNHVYAALQTGVHEFYALEQGKDSYLTSTARFEHLWIRDGKDWRLKRVYSYDHQTPNSGSELSVKNEFDLKNLTDELRKKHNIPAIAVAYLSNHVLKTIHVSGYLEAGVAAPLNTLFNVASLTKPIVTMTTLKLVENGDWSLDQPLSDFYVDPDVSNDPRSKLLTTRHVLSHQSGFKNWRHLNASGKLEFDYEPGKGFQYSGEGFEYLKHSLEAKFKLPIERLSDSLLFRPLSMNSTFYKWEDEVYKKPFAKWHDDKGINTYETYENKSASAADDLLSTISDYGLFAEYILQKAKASESLFQEMTKQQNGKINGIKMGLGWEILPKLNNNEYAILHTGGDQGVNAIIMLLPETGEGIVIFTNSDSGKNAFFPIIENTLSLGKQITGKG